MNQLQTKAFHEGCNFVNSALVQGRPLDIATTAAWVNSCLSSDRKISYTQSEYGCDANGDPSFITTLRHCEAELSGYRLLGAFSAMDSIRRKFAECGVTFSRVDVAQENIANGNKS